MRIDKFAAPALVLLVGIAGTPAQAGDGSIQNGLYGGVSGGFGGVDSNMDSPMNSGGALDGQFGNEGFSGGVFLGYNVRKGAALLGVEIEATASKTEWDNSITAEGDNFSTRKQYGLGADLRLGNIMETGALIYARAGVTRGSFKTRYQPVGFAQESDTDSEWGWRTGGGLDLPLSDQMFWRTEFTYGSHGEYAVTTANLATHSFDNNESLFRFGLGINLSRNGQNAASTVMAKPKFRGIYGGIQGEFGQLASVNEGLRTSATPGQFNTILTERADHGPGIGGFAGWGATWGDFYYGVEAEAEISKADIEQDTGPLGRTMKIEKVRAHGLGVRLGYVVNDIGMIYGRWALMRGRIKTSITRAGFINDGQEDTERGNRFGAGIETPAWGNVFMRMDYTYTNFHGNDVWTGSRVDSFKTRESQFRMGLLYRFD